MDPALTPDDLAVLRKDFTSNRAYRLVQNAVTTTSVNQVALDHEVASGIDHTVSHLLDDWAVTDQGKSGRCWLFAGLNLLRAGTMARLGVKEFEFSQNHLMFWDKIERANYFLEAIIDTADRDVDDRTVAYLLEHVADDGGQWNMFTALVAKHGLVPKRVMPETQSSGETAQLNAVLRRVLRQGAGALRAAAPDERAARKAEILAVAYRVLCIHLGTPPERFDWQWTDKDRQFHRDGELTPQEFAARYVTLPLDEYVCLVHDPRHPTGRTYTVEYLGNVVGGPRVVYLNVDVAVLKDVAGRTIMAGEPVWFGCDVGQHMHVEHGVWDARLFDYEALYDTGFGLDKASRLVLHESAMTHAMLFTGPSRHRWRSCRRGRS